MEDHESDDYTALKEVSDKILRVVTSVKSSVLSDLKNLNTGNIVLSPNLSSFSFV